MTTPPDDQSDAYEDALIIYDEHIDESIGLCLKKCPSEKQKAAIVDLIARSYEEENFDVGVILEQHARNCLEPLYLTDPKLFSEVEVILSAFLPSSHLYYQEMKLNDENPPLHIGQLLRGCLKNI